MDIHGKVAFVASEPFIISGSIVTNIIFGLDYDNEKFQSVL